MKSVTKFEVSFNGTKFLIDVADGNLMSLNEIYVAAGSPANKDPRQWDRLLTTQQLIDSVCENLHVGKSHVYKRSRARADRGGGTWAHWNIATEYAAYLNPELRIIILDVFRERVQEERDPELAFTRGRERAVNGWKRQGKNDDWIGVRLKSIDTWKSFTETAKEHGVEGSGYARCADSFNVPLLGGTSKEVRQERNIVKHNLRDSLNEEELAELELAQIRAKRKIVNDDLRGNKPCARICFDVSTRIAASR